METACPGMPPPDSTLTALMLLKVFGWFPGRKLLLFVAQCSTTLEEELKQLLVQPQKGVSATGRNNTMVRRREGHQALVVAPAASPHMTATMW